MLPTPAVRALASVRERVLLTAPPWTKNVAKGVSKVLGVGSQALVIAAPGDDPFSDGCAGLATISNIVGFLEQIISFLAGYKTPNQLRNENLKKLDGLIEEMSDVLADAKVYAQVQALGSGLTDAQVARFAKLNKDFEGKLAAFDALINAVQAADQLAAAADTVSDAASVASRVRSIPSPVRQIFGIFKTLGSKLKRGIDNTLEKFESIQKFSKAHANNFGILDGVLSTVSTSCQIARFVVRSRSTSGRRMLLQADEEFDITDYSACLPGYEAIISGFQDTVQALGAFTDEVLPDALEAQLKAAQAAAESAIVPALESYRTTVSPILAAGKQFINNGFFSTVLGVLQGVNNVLNARIKFEIKFSIDFGIFGVLEVNIQIDLGISVLGLLEQIESAFDWFFTAIDWIVEQLMNVSGLRALQDQIVNGVLSALRVDDLLSFNFPIPAALTAAAGSVANAVDQLPSINAIAAKMDAFDDIAGYISSAARGALPGLCYPPGVSVSTRSSPACPPGTYGIYPICVAAQPGTYTPGFGAASATPCAPGSAQPFNAQAGCISCPVGYYQSASGQADCLECPAGSYSDQEGSASCTLCAPGSFQSLTGQTSCQQCPAGSFSATAGATKCEKCAPGTIAAAPGSPACEKCKKGTIAATEGLTECTACSPGTIAAEEGLAVCSPCAPGSFACCARSFACAPCAPGTVAPGLGMVECDACPAGTFAGSFGGTSCSPCAPGTYAPFKRTTACYGAEPGYFVAGSGDTKQYPCPVLTYQPQRRQDSCLNVSSGYYTNDIARSAQLPCPPMLKGVDRIPTVPVERAPDDFIVCPPVELGLRTYRTKCFNQASTFLRAVEVATANNLTAAATRVSSAQLAYDIRSRSCVDPSRADRSDAPEPAPVSYVCKPGSGTAGCPAYDGPAGLTADGYCAVPGAAQPYCSDNPPPPSCTLSCPAA